MTEHQRRALVRVLRDEVAPRPARAGHRSRRAGWSEPTRAPSRGLDRRPARGIESKHRDRRHLLPDALRPQPVALRRGPRDVRD
jgi:hypothetical protein